MKKYLQFKLNEEKFLLDIQDVHSIIEYKQEQIRSIPNVDNSILGLLDLRGEVVLIIDTLYRLYNKITDRSENIIIINFNNGKLGLLVDYVIGVIELDENKFQDNVTVLIKSPFFKQSINIDDDIEILLNIENLVDFQTFNKIREENK